MRYRTLGHSDIQVSEIGFGCWTMGGPNFSSDNGQPIGWKEVDKNDVLAGIRAGLDAGVNHFDNADVYGNGKAERLLRECLTDLGHLAGPNRDKLVIATKVGHFKGTGPHAYTPFNIRKQCEQSLANLGLDHLDLYYFHHGWYATDDQPGNLADAAGTMHELVVEGKVRAVGQSAYSDDDFARAIPVVKPAALQSWANMLKPNFIEPGARLPALMNEHRCSFIAFGPLGQGLLLDKFDPKNPPKFDEGDVRGNNTAFTADELAALKPKLQALKERFGPTTEDLASAACRFVLAHDHVAGVIPGFRNESQALCNLRAATDDPFSTEDLAFCRELFANP